MKEFLSVIAIISILACATAAEARPTEGKPGKITGRTVGSAAMSLLIWPGIGQAINENPYEKNVTHAFLGITVVFRLWSCYDALVDRKGGVWHNRI